MVLDRCGDGFCQFERGRTRGVLGDQFQQHRRARVTVGVQPLAEAGDRLATLEPSCQRRPHARRVADLAQESRDALGVAAVFRPLQGR